MKKIIQTAILFSAFIIISGCAAICRAQPGRAVGGFRDASKTEETIVLAANFAVDTQSNTQNDASLKLISIARAERQIVMGSNYRICLVVGSQNKQQEAVAVIYHDLQNQFSLTSWTPGKCTTGSQTNQSVKPAEAETENTQSETENYKGTLEVGKTDSAIVYLGEESGDLAAFCFTNNSVVGRAVLAACKAGEQCEFTGEIDYENACKIKDERELSASGKITAIKSVKSLTRKTAAAAKPAAPAKPATALIAPETLVANLYKVQKTGAGPFFQSKNRAVIDQYFAKDFADLIWNDAVTSEGEVGVLGFDPLFNAQDQEITSFVIGKPEYDRNSGVAIVLVKFKNFGKAETVKFLLEPDAAKNWKIMDIVYQNGDMLKGMYFEAKAQ